MNYKDLIIWKKSFTLTSSVYKITQNFPKEELFGLTSQIRRSALSIPSNIAEGKGHDSDLDFARFLNIAKGLANELECQLLIAENLNYISSQECKKLCNECNEIIKMIVSFIKKLKTNS
jgi:four helix bundle protein